MDYIINQEILDWLNNHELPGNISEMENNFSYDDVGDWEGEEELAISQLNRIMLNLEFKYEGIKNKEVLADLKSKVWSDWSKDTRILDAKEKDIIDYINGAITSASVMLPDNNVVC